MIDIVGCQFVLSVSLRMEILCGVVKIMIYSTSDAKNILSVKYAGQSFL